MDLDTTLRNCKLTKESIAQAINEIILIKLNDNVCFEIKSIESIRKDDIYGGYCVRLNAIFETIITPFSIDVSTGDVITPDAVKYELTGIFDDEIKISLWGYNIETVLAEKVETILSRGVFSTRLKDYYDVYILSTNQKYLPSVFKDAFLETVGHRKTNSIIDNANEILSLVSNSSSLRKEWRKYQNKYEYAKDISYEKIISVLTNLIGHLN